MRCNYPVNGVRMLIQFDALNHNILFKFKLHSSLMGHSFVFISFRAVNKYVDIG